MLTYILFLIASVSLTTSDVHIDTYEGNWEGAIVINSQELGIQLMFTYSDEELDGTIDIPAQQAYNLPVEVHTASEDSLVFQFQTGSGPAVFSGTRVDQLQRIEGLFEQAGQTFPFYLNRSSNGNGTDVILPEQELLIPTVAGKVSGSLILSEEPSPLIILVSGSGAQDKDSNVAGFRVFGELSRHLYKEGYSTFRYDDRGINESTGDPDATLQELSNDLVEIIDYLRQSFGEDFSNIILAGHSQGGLVASIAANETAVGGILYMAVPFFRGDEIINQQIRILSEENDVPEAVVEQNLQFQERIYNVARNELDWGPIEEDLSNRLAAQIDRLPEQQRNALGDMSSFIQSQVDRQLSAAKSRWFKSLIEFEPETAILNLQISQLAVFGEKDMQVLSDKNYQKADELQKKSATIESVIIPDANHLFQVATTGMPTEYGMLDREFSILFLEEITSWLNSFREQTE